MNECKYCGRQCENEYCCDEHRKYQIIWEKGDVVNCPKCGKLCQCLSSHIRIHKNVNFRIEFPKMKYSSLKHSELVRRNTLLQLARETEEEKKSRYKKVS
jgi:hypothetical protein